MTRRSLRFPRTRGMITNATLSEQLTADDEKHDARFRLQIHAGN